MSSADTPNPDPGANSDGGQSFVYRGWHFLCKVSEMPNGLFRPSVRMSMPGSDGVKKELSSDTEPYASKAEAARHAEQQAVRWGHDRTGDGRGQF